VAPVTSAAEASRKVFTVTGGLVLPHMKDHLVVRTTDPNGSGRFGITPFPDQRESS